MSNLLQIGLWFFLASIQLDITGTAQVFSSLPDVSVHLIWKNRRAGAERFRIDADADVTFDDCPQLDVICVPGGYGTDELRSTGGLAFLRKQEQGAQYVTSVCTGSLVLGAAGLSGISRGHALDCRRSVAVSAHRSRRKSLRRWNRVDRRRHNRWHRFRADAGAMLKDRDRGGDDPAPPGVQPVAAVRCWLAEDAPAAVVAAMQDPGRDCAGRRWNASGRPSDHGIADLKPAMADRDRGAVIADMRRDARRGRAMATYLSGLAIPPARASQVGSRAAPPWQAPSPMRNGACPPDSPAEWSRSVSSTISPARVGLFRSRFCRRRKMAVEDFQKATPGINVEIVIADHQNKPE